MTTTEPVDDGKGGLPLWLPLLGLLVALGFTFFLGARICPVLSALVFPPSPKLPNGSIKEVERVQKGVGLNEYLYSTNLTGCEIALFYQDWLEDCNYDPDINCSPGRPETRFNIPNQAYHVATCTGNQFIGIFNMRWTAYISSGYSDGDKTFFRLIGEVSH